MNTDIKAITEAVARESAFVEPLLAETQKVIVGQKPLLERVLIKYPNSLEAPGARAALAAIKAKGKESSFDAQSTPRHGGG